MLHVVQCAYHYEEGDKTEGDFVGIPGVNHGPFFPLKNAHKIVAVFLEKGHIAVGVSELSIAAEGKTVKWVLPVPDGGQPDHQKVLYYHYQGDKNDHYFPANIEPSKRSVVLVCFIELVYKSGEYYSCEEVDQREESAIKEEGNC